MRYLLDTCVLSDFARRYPEVLAHVKGASPARLATTFSRVVTRALSLYSPAVPQGHRPALEMHPQKRDRRRGHPRDPGSLPEACGPVVG
jgi:predicted nucleic acid-binding protein